MKIYYFASVHSQVEVETEINVTPKKLGTTAEHLAYAISAAVDKAQELLASNPQVANLNDAIRNIFVACMQESAITQEVMAQQSLPVDFDFTSQNLQNKLARHFILKGILN